VTDSKRESPARRRPRWRAPQPTTGGIRRRAIGEKLEPVLADLDDVAALKQVLLDRLPVDGRAVGRTQVLEVDVGTIDENDCVLAADGKVVDDEVIVRSAADGRAFFGEVDLAQHDAVQAQHQSRHLSVLQGVLDDANGFCQSAKTLPIKLLGEPRTFRAAFTP